MLDADEEADDGGQAADPLNRSIRRRAAEVYRRLGSPHAATIEAQLHELGRRR